MKNANDEERFWRKSEKFNEKRGLAQKMRGKFGKIDQERIDVQIESARNGRRDSLMKSRGQDTYKIHQHIPCANMRTKCTM